MFTDLLFVFIIGITQLGFDHAQPASTREPNQQPAPRLELSSSFLHLEFASPTQGTLESSPAPEELASPHFVETDIHLETLPGEAIANQFVIVFNREHDNSLSDFNSLQLTRTLESQATAFQVREIKTGHMPISPISLQQERPQDDGMPSETGFDYSSDYVVVEVTGDIDDFLEEVRALPEVDSVTPRQKASILAPTDDPLYGQQHALPRIQAPGAWQRGAGTHAPVIAVIDSGTDYEHPDLVARFGDLKGYDFVNNTADPRPLAAQETHGTLVSGVIAAEMDNAIGISGVISPVVLLSLRALNEDGNGTQDDVADAILWAVQNEAEIINMSLGGGHDPVLQAAVQYAWDQGVLLVAASGNSGQNNIRYPAGYPEVIAVGALNRTDELAYFSSFGAAQELVAPGTAILSTAPVDQYSEVQGTSFAAPLVTGVAALLLSHNPALTHEQLRSILATSADDLGTPGRDDHFGHGRVNALIALDQLLGAPTRAPLVLHNNHNELLTVNDVSLLGDWFAATPDYFTIWPEGEQTVYVTFEAVDLGSGVYDDILTVYSDDAQQPERSIPVGASFNLPPLDSPHEVNYGAWLLPGWNLRSLPLEPLEPTAPELPVTLAAAGDRLYAYDGCNAETPWRKFDADAPPWANSLDSLDGTMGFWHLAAAPAVHSLRGTFRPTATLSLCPGWNLVAYPALQNRPVVDALASIETCYGAIYTFDPLDAADPWKKYDPNAPTWANDLSLLIRGRGYWILAHEACTWAIDDSH